MRAGICTVQQSLTIEALSIVKQAVSLARRRGHAQVTPLHVASAMLASSNGLLRRACLQSHSHPLQCKALELCFNVALNRLPASTSNALLGPINNNSSSQYPSMSNALVAAFKRAQAHQRRGSIENQQQPILALKIEIEQFIISILDDPSVSRVMREAGFSSTQVKNNVEQVVSLEICSPNTTTTTTKEITKQKNTTTMFHSLPFSSQFEVGLMNKPFDHQVSNEDAMSVLNTLVDKKRNMVITGECSATTQSVVREVMEKIERGLGPGELRFIRFVSFPLYSLRDQSKDEVEKKLVELRCIVKSYLSGGVVLYLGDLKWVSDFWSSYGEQRRSTYYSSGEHIVMEIKRLIRGIGETGRLWLMGSATFQTYMKCKAGHPSLETIWELYPHTIPLGSLSLSLGLSLNLDHSNSQSQSKNKASTYLHSWPMLESGVDNQVRDFSVNFDRETESIGRDNQTNEFTSGSSLPPWLQQCKDMTRRTTIDDNKEHFSTISSSIFKRWNSFGSSIHHKEPNYNQKTIKFASSPPSPISISSHECKTSLNQLTWPLSFEPENLSKEKELWISNNEVCESNMMINLSKPDLLSNPNSSPNSASSSEAIDDDEEGLERFKEYNDQNLKILSSSLEKKVPWQKDIIPEIATTILECRSRQSKKAKNGHEREESWLFFLGVDTEGKQNIARELARVVFGSQASFVSISASNFSSCTRDDSTEESSKMKKRGREEFGCSQYERLGLALNENPHRVFIIEDVEQIDFSSQKAMKEAIESGKMSLSGGENVPLRDAIVIFSCESSSSAVSRACSPRIRLKNNENDESKDEVVSLDLNIAIELVDDGDDEYSSNFAQDGILQYVDRQIIFKHQQL